MLTFLSSFIPSLSTRYEPDEPTLALSGKAAEELKALAETYHLGAKGSLALTQWTCWLSYAATQSKIPHITDDPGWKVVLPIDKKHAQEHLYRMLLRAGEPQDTALETAMACYPFMHVPILESRLLPRPLKCARPEDGIADFAAKDLPAHAVPFESLPTWAREVALFATDLTEKSLSGMELSGLDLRYLSAYGTDISERDLRGSDFSHTDMRRAKMSRTNIDGRRMQGAMTSPVDSALERSHPRWNLFDPDHRSYPRWKEQENFLHDREILQVLPITHTRQVDGVDIGYTQDGKSIIQQQTIRGSSAGVSAMLIADHGGEIKVDELLSRGAANDNQVRMDIKAAGMRAVTLQVSSIRMLADRLDAAGAAIVSLDDEIGGHYIIVDAVDLERHVAQLRDPFHGWAITVPLVAFTSRWKDPNPIIIQIAPPGAETFPHPTLWP